MVGSQRQPVISLILHPVPPVTYYGSREYLKKTKHTLPINKIKLLGNFLIVSCTRYEGKNLVVEVDDSGWGDLIGGVVIVMRRVETDESHVGEVPLEMFQGNEFKYKMYLRATTMIILNGIDELNIRKSESLHICTGYIFTSAKETLREIGYNVVESRITGRTQELAEEEFLKSLKRLGLGSIDYLRKIRSFNGFLKWVKEDLPGRERYVKTGWKSWVKHRGS